MPAPSLPSWVSGYIGIPFQYRGQSRDGADCWGLLDLVYREVFGTPLPEYPGVRWDKGESMGRVGDGAKSYASLFQRVDIGSEQMGDGVLLRMAGHPLHVGLVVAPGWMLHSSEGAMSCIENYGRPIWAKRVLGIFRYCR